MATSPIWLVGALGCLLGPALNPTYPGIFFLHSLLATADKANFRAVDHYQCRSIWHSWIIMVFTFSDIGYTGILLGKDSNCQCMIINLILIVCGWWVIKPANTCYALKSHSLKELWHITFGLYSSIALCWVKYHFYCMRKNDIARGEVKWT